MLNVRDSLHVPVANDLLMTARKAVWNKQFGGWIVQPVHVLGIHTSPVAKHAAS